MGLRVDNPFWFLALIPAVVMIFLFARKRTALLGARKTIWLAIRSLVLLFLILALAGLQWLLPVTTVSTVFVADRSHSMVHQQSAELTYIQHALDHKPKKDSAAIVTVGEEASVEVPMSKNTTVINKFETTVNPDYSNLANGLQIAGSLFGDHDRGRIVLMSDGNENIGDMKQQARYLHEQGYVVDVVPFDVKSGKDAAVDELDVPSTVFSGEKVPVTVTVKSTIETNSRLRISEDHKIIVDQKIHLKAGLNRFTFLHLDQSSGFHTYRAEIITDGDSVSENNNGYAFSETKGLPRVLIVEGKPGVANNLTKSLKSSAVETKVISPNMLPTELGGYLNYDSIVFANVSATDLGKTRMNLIEKAVKDFGVGFIMTGGDQSYGLGGYFQTPIEQLLPVSMALKGKKKLPSLGLVIVLDKSGSMQGEKIAFAREAAARSINMLRPKDTLGVIAFDSTSWQVIQTGPIGDKKKAADKIRSVTAGGGTNIFSPLQLAYKELKPLKLKRKHVILLTDGQSQPFANWPQMIRKAKDDHITLSTVAVGTGANTALLARMAKIGGGRFYNVQDASSIPTIFSRETALLTRTYIVDDPFYPKLASHTKWDPFFQKGVPQMNAYIATSPKGRAEQILISKKGDPVLARWQYGLGKSVAWTSDLTGKWSGDWPAWNQWSGLWNKIVTWSFPHYEQSAYSITKSIEGNQVRLEITSDGSRSVLPSIAKLVTSDGKAVDMTLNAKAPGVFEADFTAKHSGVYFLQLAGNGSRFQTGVVVPYSQEFNLNGTNMSLLKQVAQVGGGKFLKNPEGAFADDLPPSFKRQSLAFPLLIAALVFFLLDVAVRRFAFRFAFLGHLLELQRRTAESRRKETEFRSSQMEQLNRAKEKKEARLERKPSEGDPVFKEERRPIKKAAPVRQETSNAESREDRMARLLEAKNKKRKS